MCAPGLEVEIELAAPLVLGRSVGDDDLDRLVVDLVGNAAPPVQEVPQVRAESWIGKSNAHGEESRLASWRVRGPRAHSRRLPSTTPGPTRGKCRLLAE